MTEVPAQHLTFRAVVREVATVYRRHWLLLIGAAVVFLIPQALADAFLDGLQVEGIRSARDVIIVAAVPLTVAVNLAGQALYSGFAASAVVEWRAGRAVPGAAALARSLPWVRLVMVDVVVSVGAAIGFTLLVVPGLVFLAYFTIAPALIKIEHLGVTDSLKRSASLVRGHFWGVLRILVGTIVISEALAQTIVSPFHGLAVVAVIDLGVQGLIAPIEGLTVVVVALALLQLRGEAPAPGALATALTGSPE
jgi:hypothetical protein